MAIEFHLLREKLREQGTLLVFGPGSFLCAWLADYPIYRVELWDVGQAAEVVDHIIPHRGDPELMWSEWNWQPPTKRAHDRKTATEDRGQRPEDGT